LLSFSVAPFPVSPSGFGPAGAVLSFNMGVPLGVRMCEAVATGARPINDGFNRLMRNPWGFGTVVAIIVLVLFYLQW
jgi:hypothetical protein